MSGLVRTGGRWHPDEWPVYFIASEPRTLGLARGGHDHLLVAVNELHAERDLDAVRGFIAAGDKVLIDSGVYWLATRHASLHGISMDDALALAPDEIDGFADLYRRYVSLAEELGDQSWGYIEIDQGGRDNKIKTRARLEAQGLRPIPVYHPLNDGWDYFDELASGYDRICFGNVVQADVETRKRLVATAWERRRRYPHLWIHVLGLSPSEMTTAWPLNSCDSSTWLSSVRWGVHNALVANKACWPLGAGFNYRHGEEIDGDPHHYKARAFCGCEAGFVSRMMRVMAEEQTRALGCDIGAFAA